MRKGRFDEIFCINLPNQAEREAIWEIQIRKYGRNAGDFDIPNLAKMRPTTTIVETATQNMNHHGSIPGGSRRLSGSSALNHMSCRMIGRFPTLNCIVLTMRRAVGSDILHTGRIRRMRCSVNCSGIIPEFGEPFKILDVYSSIRGHETSDESETMNITTDREGITRNSTLVPIGTKCQYIGHIERGMVRVELPNGNRVILHPHCFAEFR